MKHYPSPRSRAQQGGALLYYIVVLVVLGIMVTPMMNLFTTSVEVASTPYNYKRAYYMAESGLRYLYGELNKVSDRDDVRDLITTLNANTYTVDSSNNERFDIAIYSISSFKSLSEGSPLNSGDILTLEAEFGEITQEFVDELTAAINSADGLWMVVQDSGAWVQGQNLILITGVSSWTSTEIELTLQDAFSVALGQYMYFGVPITATGSIDANNGGVLEVGNSASLLPDRNAAVWIEGQEFFYTKKELRADGRYDLHFDGSGVSATLQPSEFVILNSDNNHNQWAYVTGYAGTGEHAAQWQLRANIAVDLNGNGTGSVASHDEYVLNIGGGWPTDEERYGTENENPADGEYAGAQTSDGVWLDSTNMADLDATLGLESGTANAGGDDLNTVARYGTNSADTGTLPDDYYNDVGDYEFAVQTGSTAVVSSADFVWHSDLWYDFHMEYNVGDDFKLVWKVVKDQAAGDYVQIADPAHDPDESGDLIVAPADVSSTNRFLSNFWLHAKGRIVNNNKIFVTTVRGMHIRFDGDLWPVPQTWAPGLECENTVGKETYVKPTASAIVADPSLYGKYFACDTAGVTGSSEPAWSQDPSTTITDGTAAWVFGVPEFESVDDYTYFLTQRDSAATKVEVDGEFQFHIDWSAGTPSSEYGFQFYLQLHDLAK